MNVGALDRREKGETTLIQTTDPTARVSIPRSLKWNEITFPADWTLENENHVLQIQNPVQNPDLDFVQQLADGTVRLCFDRSRPSTPCRQPLDISQFRSPIQPINQPLDSGEGFDDCTVMKTDAEIWKTIKMYRTIRKGVLGYSH